MTLSCVCRWFHVIRGCCGNKERQLCRVSSRLTFHKGSTLEKYEDEYTIRKSNPKTSANKGKVIITSPQITRSKPKEKKKKKELLFGIHPVTMALVHGKRKIYELLVKEGLNNEPAKHIMQLAEQHQMKKKFVCTRTLDRMAEQRPHQGVVLHVSALEIPVLNFGQISHTTLVDQKPPVWLLMYQIKDPMNVGGILRSAYFLGVERIIVTEKHCGGLTPFVSKASSGALEVIPLSRCKDSDVSKLLQQWKDIGGLVVGTSSSVSDGTIELEDFSTDKPVLLISGNEKEGLRDDIMHHCDTILSINPAEGIVQEVDSLNVSVATGIILHSIMARRRLTDKPLFTADKSLVQSDNSVMKIG